jgi:predicted DNA-binding transcriptional regulator YafY
MPRGSAAPQLRLQAIETLLLWEGRVSRRRLLDLFDVHPTLASRDIAAYRARFPGACQPSEGGKSFEASDTLAPTLTTGGFEDYQRLIGSIGVAAAVMPGVALEQIQADRTRIGFRVFAALHRAVRGGTAVRVQYRSMAQPKAHARTIRPHAFIQAGPRWHIRAYCEESSGFRDFNLGRIVAAQPLAGMHLPGAEADAAWSRMIRLRFLPHQDLTSEQAALVRDEFMEGTSALAFEVRQPLARYLVHALGAAVDPDVEKPPRHLLMVKSPRTLPTGTLWSAPGEV